MTKTEQVCSCLAHGMTIKQACAKVGMQERTFLARTSIATGRARMEAMVIEDNLRVIKNLRDNPDGKPEVRLKAAEFFLERIYRRQYGQDDRQIIVHAEQTNYSLDAQDARAIDARAERLLGPMNEAQEGRLPDPLDSGGPERS